MCGVTRRVIPAASAALRQVRSSTWMSTGLAPQRLGNSQRRLRWLGQNARRSARTGAGSGTIRCLVPVPMMRSRRRALTMPVTSRLRASLQTILDKLMTGL